MRIRLRIRLRFSISCADLERRLPTHLSLRSYNVATAWFSHRWEGYAADTWPETYIQKVIAAGGIKKYERNHLNALAAIFAPRFAHRSLPPEMVRRVVEYAFHVGDY